MLPLHHALRDAEGLTADELAKEEDFWYYIQQSFTVSPGLINLNNGGVSPAPKTVQDAMKRYYDYCNEAPSYYMWRILDQGREPLRKKLSKLAGCDSEEIAINRNSSEGLETVIFGMRQTSIDQSRHTEKASEDNRRGTERVPAQFSLMYSGMSDGRMLIGNGVVSNVSKSGIGILGNHLVKRGMDLSLFIDLPGLEEPICIAETRVSWVAGRRFGVEMIAPKLDVQNELRFYVWNHLYRQDGKKP